MSKTRYESDKKGRLHRINDGKVGQAPTFETYIERRAAMTWPTPNNEGYYCVFGLKDLVTHKNTYPVEILAELKTKDQDKLFGAVITAMSVLKCNVVYADCSREFQSNMIDFAQALNKSGSKDIGLYDASPFEGFTPAHGGFDAAALQVDRYGREGLLIAGDSTILRQELKSIMPDVDHKTARPWEQYPAINAYNYILMSYTISPYRKAS